MNYKVGDLLVPKHMIGEVIEETDKTLKVKILNSKGKEFIRIYDKDTLKNLPLVKVEVK